MSETVDMQWESICPAEELTPLVGVRALLDDEQIALFKVKDHYYAVSAMDPFSNAAVMARGIVGDLKGELVVASPVYKQHFKLATGECMEDSSVFIKTYPVRESDGQLQVARV